MPELNIIAECSPVKVPAPDRLDYIVGKVCAGRYKYINMPGFHEIGNNPAHTGRHHCAGKPEEFCCLLIAQHLFINGCRP